MKLNECIYKINVPILFKNILKQDSDDVNKNSCVKWTPELLSVIFNNDTLFQFRIGKKSTTHLEVQFENECNYVEATISQFLLWIDGKIDERDTLNPFKEYNFNDYWAYCDYKYMNSLIHELQNDELNEHCIDWGAFGFDNRNANDSTFWLGTQGAYTPCHYDTYGYNLVYQLYGKKRWIMFPKSDTPFMSPSRVPYEESTIYSEINIKHPDLNKYKQFCNSHPYIVELEPGDVLYVPHHWWHYVECIDLAISINSWVELESDDEERFKESLTKTLLQGLMESNFISFENWLNTSEPFSSQEENLEVTESCFSKLNKGNKHMNTDDNETCENKKRKLSHNENNEIENNYKSIVESHKNFCKYIDKVDFDAYIIQYTTSKIDLKSHKKVHTNANKIDNQFLLNLSKALTNPLTINLITSLIEQNHS